MLLENITTQFWVTISWKTRPKAGNQRLNIRGFHQHQYLPEQKNHFRNLKTNTDNNHLLTWTYWTQAGLDRAVVVDVEFPILKTETLKNEWLEMRPTVAHWETTTICWTAKRGNLKNVKISQAEEQPRLIISIKTNLDWSIRARLHMSVSTPKLVNSLQQDEVCVPPNPGLEHKLEIKSD